MGEPRETKTLLLVALFLRVFIEVVVKSAQDDRDIMCKLHSASSDQRKNSCLHSLTVFLYCSVNG